MCPANCIKLVPGEDENGNRYPLVFEIDEFRCIFCGYCQEVCPEEAIHVGRHYENSEYSRDGFVYDLERLMAQTHPVCGAVGPRRPERRVMIAPSQGIPMAHGTLPLLYTFHFYLFGLIAVASALLFVTRKSPVAAALWLVNTMFCLAALFVLLDAQFIGAIAGARLRRRDHGGVPVRDHAAQPRPVVRAADIRGIGWKIAAGAVGIAHPRATSWR